jgi:6-phosphogluconolactonase
MKVIRIAALFLALLAIAGCGTAVPSPNAPPVSTPIFFMYVVGPNAQDVFGFDQTVTDLFFAMAPPTTGTTLQPTSVVVHPSGNFAYVANFGSNDVTLYKRDSAIGTITPLGSLPPTSVGTAPVALAIDSKGQFLYVLNQGSASASASISAFTIDPLRGLLSELSGSPFPTTGNPTAFTFSGNNFLYVANGAAGTISAFGVNADGSLFAVSGSPFTAPGTMQPNLSALTVDPKAGFLYATDFANSTVVGFSIQSNGTLSNIGGSPFTLDGTSPLGIAIDATGTFLYVGDRQVNPFVSGSTGSISGLKINGSSGALTPLARSPFTTGANTTAAGYMTIDPKNEFLYNANPNDNSITVSAINTTTGVLTQVAGTPFSLGTEPSWITVTVPIINGVPQ